MINFESFYYSNFEGVGSAGIKYTFSNGMTRLIGENGVGKSSLANGVYFCLTGKPYKNKIVIKSLINTINKKNLKTELVFKKNDTRYKVVRNLAPDKFEIYKETDGKFILEKHLSSKDPYQNVLDRILGCDRKVLEQVLIRSNLKTNSFLALEKQEKRDYLDKTVDIFILQQVKKKNSLKVDELKELLLSMDRQLQQLQTKIFTEEENIARLEKLKNEINEGRKALIEEKLKTVKEEFSSLKIGIASLKQDLKDAEERKNSLDLEISTLKLSLKEKKSQFSNEKNLGFARVTLEVNESFQAQTQKLDEEIKDSQNKFTSTIEKLDSDNAKVLKEIKVKADALVEEKRMHSLEKKTKTDALNEELNALFSKSNAARQDIAVFNQKFAFFKTNCGSCEKLKKLESIESISDLEALIEKNDILIAEIKNKVAEVESVYESKAKELLAAMEKCTEEKHAQQLEYEKQYSKEDANYVAEQKALKNSLKELSVKKTEQIEFKKQTILLEIQTAESACEKSYNETISLIDVTPVIVEIKEKQQAISFKTDAAKKIADEGQSLKKELEDINKESETVIDKTVLNKLSEEEAELKNKIKEKEKSLEEYSVINNVLTKDNGIRNWILKKFLGFINKKINDYLEEMNETIIFTFNENLEEVFKDKVRAGLSFGNLSEGQKKRIDLAILLTFLDVANMQAKNKFNLIFLDEILFGLHESIIPLVLKIFEKRKEYQEVIIMEHNKVSDTCFDRIFEFKMTKEFFTVMNLKK